MKTMKIIMIAFIALVFVTGCKKNEDTPVLDATADEAAAIMATSFCTGNAGSMTQVEDAVTLSQSAALKAALTDSSFTISSVPGALITYQYQVQYSYGFVTANNYKLEYSSAGNYTSPNVTANVTATGTLNVTGFASGNALYVNGQSGRTGSFTMKIGNNSSITGTVTATLANFTFNKSTLVCESGTAAIVVNGTTSAGRNFSFSGTLVYQGNYVATLTLAGKNYSVNLNTGAVTK